MAQKGNREGSTSASGTVHADASSLAAAAVADGGRHVAVLADETVDEWHRTLTTAGALPGQRHFVSVDDTVRSAVAGSASGPQTRPLGDDVYVSVAERPVGPEFAEFVASALPDPADGPGGSLVVDDPSVLADDTDLAGPLERLSGTAAEAGVSLRFGVPDDEAVAAALWRLCRPADAATERRLAAAALAHFRATDPTNFGYLRQHWREARRGVEAVEMTYPQARQIHTAIPDPETTARTLGAALQGFVNLGALGVWGETVAATRYDLTGYDPERAAAIGAALDALDD